MVMVRGPRLRCAWDCAVPAVPLLVPQPTHPPPVVPHAPHALTFRLLRMSVHVYTLQLCAATASVILRGLKAPPTRVTLNWRMHLDSVSAGQPMLSDDQLRAIQVVCHPLPPPPRPVFSVPGRCTITHVLPPRVTYSPAHACGVSCRWLARTSCLS